MGRRLATSLTVMLLLATFLPWAAAEELTKEQQAKQDAAKLLQYYEELHPKFEGVYGGSAVYGTSEAEMLETCAALEQKLKMLEEEVLPVLQPFLGEVAERYGETSGDVEWALKQLRVEEHAEAGNRFDALLRDIKNIHKTRVASAEMLSTHVQSMGDVSFFVADVRVKKLELFKQFLQYAVKFDPTNVYANQRLAKMDQEIADCRKTIEQEIDNGKWFGQVADYPGPGTVSELTQAALAYFRKHPEWGREGLPDQTTKGVAVLAVAVRGPWLVAERDFFGRVTCWRLPIHLAVSRPADKARGVGRVYELSLCAQEGPPGKAPKAPPFDGYWVGNSWYIRLSKLPQP